MDQTATRFIQRNYEPQDRLAFVAIDRSAESRPAIQLFAKAAKADGLMPLLEGYNASRDIYVSVNPVKPEAGGRTKADIAEVRHIFADFDVDGRQRIEDMIRSRRVPRPNEIVFTSPGKAQTLWRVKEFSHEQAEALTKGLVREFGADPAAVDVARMMRLPGFENRKYDPTHYVGVTRVHTGRATPEQFPVYEQEHQRGPVRGYERGANAPGGISQSERDWAFAREAYRRGMDPQEIQARLEDMRPDKPHGYAERTMRNVIASRDR